MIIYINGSKYEIEAVVKLFFPLERFEFKEDAPVRTDGCIIARTDETLFVYAAAGGRKAERSAPLPEDPSENEITLCRLLFTALTELTGVTPAWGCLTGIRPVKKINTLMSRGMDYEQMYSYLHRKYLISRSKFDLIFRTAQGQRHALDTYDPHSFSLYIGIPFCPSRCSYCSFVSHSITSKGAKQLIPQYVDMLIRELRETGEMLRGTPFHCDTVYIGGGTPTAIDAHQLSRIMGTAADSFDLSAVREYTVEAGRPDTITEDKLSVIKEHATRISINPQTLSDSVLRNIGRIHSARQFYDAFDLARKMGFDSVNTDTIAGLPGDTAEGFRATIDGLIALSPENITVHTLTVKRSATLFQGTARGDLAADDTLMRMVDYAGGALADAGYSPYYLYRQKNTIGNLENIGFSKPGHEGLYNIYIMEEIQNIISCGAGASTKIIDHSTGKITRSFNYKYPYEYISRYDKMTEYKKTVRQMLTEN
ncbi:MAG: coproporphyrinogen dehydrogenase HemZ [Oscillospiraceae bacterium]|nr:coproporphyrinogen dehydrogenase HemZ [Oscillospiraceae bacterium]